MTRSAPRTFDLEQEPDRGPRHSVQRFVRQSSLRRIKPCDKLFRLLFAEATTDVRLAAWNLVHNPWGRINLTVNDNRQTLAYAFTSHCCKSLPAALGETDCNLRMAQTVPFNFG